jgi:ATP-grasp domain/L-amino acid ligase C-terminal domain 2/ATP-grasp N-terminal domain
MTLPRILLFATTTGYQTRAFSDAAAALGVELVFATDRCDQLDDPWRDDAIAIRFHEEDRSTDAVIDACRRRPVDGVLVVGDRPTVLAARVAERLGLRHHSPAAASIARDKLRTRERLLGAGLVVPWFRVCSIDEATSAIAADVGGFPCVVKPISLSGSRGVIRADDGETLAAAIDRLRTLLDSPELRAERNPAHRFLLVEGFIPGREFAVEGIMDSGGLQVLAIFDKPNPLDGPFFEETIYVTPSRASAHDQRAIAEATAQAARAIGLSHGPIHAECRVNERGVYMLEVAARPIGGLCAGALRFERACDATHEPPIPLEELLLRHAMGATAHGWQRERCASGVMMIPIPRRGVFRAVAGLEKACAVEGIVEIRMTAKTDQVLVPLPEGASYLGFIFARGRDAEEVDCALRAAHARLRFVVDPGLNVLAGSHLNYNQMHG